MPTLSEKIQLKPFADLTLRNRYQFGIDLAYAVASSQELELPYVVEGYKNAFRGIRRLGKIAHLARENYMHPYVITVNESWPYATIQPKNVLKDNEVRPRGSGVATAQNYYQSEAPRALDTADLESTEVGYWLRQADGETSDSQVQLGTAVLSKLVELQNPDSHLWSVVPPKHGAKTEVLRLAGFESLGVPTQYELGDGCDIPRQLWHKQI